MATGDGERSAIGRAVEQLTAALLKTDEAVIHGDEAARATAEMARLHRLAGADAERMATPITLGSKAEENVRTGLASLRSAAAAVRNYIAVISPNDAVKVSSKEASSPRGTGLLDTSHRVRSLAQLSKEGVRRAEDLHDLTEKASELPQSVWNALRPVDPGSLRSETQPPPGDGPVVRTGTAGPAADPTVAYTVLAVLVFRTGERAVSILRSAFRKGLADHVGDGHQQ